MKKRIVIGSLFVLFAAGLFAQEGVKFGLKINPLVGFATITDADKAKIDNMKLKVRVGYSWGLAISYGFNETVGFQTGIQLASKGFAGSEPLANLFDSTGTIDAGFKQSFTTLEVPFALKLRSPEIGSGLHVIGLFGATFDFNISNRYEIDQFIYEVDSAGTPTSWTGNTETRITRDSKRVNLFQVSVLVGAGVDWEFDWGMLQLGLSYHMGLMNIINKKNTVDRNVKLSYVALDLGYFF